MLPSTDGHSAVRGIPDEEPCVAEISYGLVVALSTPAFTVSPFEVTGCP